MIKKVDINDMADYVILMCNENGVDISPLKLQKLLYYIQAWHMVYFDQAKIFDELPQAWVNGPVYPSIYHRFKSIPRYFLITSDNANIHCSLQDKAEQLNLSDDQFAFLDSIFQFYGVMDHDRLVFLTHSELPWSEKREGLMTFEQSTRELSPDTMYKYYHDRLVRNRSKKVVSSKSTLYSRS